MNWISDKPPASLHIAAITAGEIQAGIERARASDPAKAREIEAWLDELVFSITVLEASAAVYRLWAKLKHGRSNHHLEDILIAATALHHELTIVTRNVRDFEPFGVKLLNPFDRTDL